MGNSLGNRDEREFIIMAKRFTGSKNFLVDKK